MGEARDMSVDLLHPAGPGREWGESLYFNVYDQDNDICAFMRVGLKPNMNERSAFCFFLMPDGSLVGMSGNEPCGPISLYAMGLSIRTVEPEKRWLLKFNGHMGRLTEGDPVPTPVSFELDFEARNQATGFIEHADGKGDGPAQKAVLEHLGQFGKVSGSLMVGTEQFDISGRGGRNHTWGTLDWSRYKMWFRLTGQYSDNVAFSVTKKFTEQREASGGYFHMYGKDLPVVKANVRTVLDPDGTPCSMAMSLVDEAKGKHKITAEVLRMVAIPFPSRDGRTMSVLHEALAEFDLNGQKGYGIAEYLVRKQ